MPCSLSLTNILSFKLRILNVFLYCIKIYSLLFYVYFRHLLDVYFQPLLDIYYTSIYDVLYYLIWSKCLKKGNGLPRHSTNILFPTFKMIFAEVDPFI